MADRIVFDSEINALACYLRNFPFQFLGPRACELAEELGTILEDHLDARCSLAGFDFRDEDEY